MPEITDPALLQQLNSGPTQRPPRPSGPRPIMLSPGDPAAAARIQAAEDRAAAAEARAQAAEARAAGKDARDQQTTNARGGVDTTEGERTAAFLAARVAGGINDLARIGDIGAPSLKDATVGGTLLGNYTTDEARQRAINAQRDILDAALTLGTGAAYTQEQIDAYRAAYFPQPGDKPATVQDKQLRLQRLLESARVKAGAAAGQIDDAIRRSGVFAAPTEAGQQPLSVTVTDEGDNVTNPAADPDIARQAAQESGWFNNDTPASQALSGINEGVGYTLGAPVDLVNSALGVGAQGLNFLTGSNLSVSDDPLLGSKWWQEQMRGFGAIGPESERPGMPFLRRTAQSLGAAFVPGLGSVRTAGQALGLGASALGGGLGAATAREVAPGNPYAEMGGELIGSGMFGLGALARARRNAQREIEAAVPTIPQLKEQAGDLYRQAESRGVVGGPNVTGNIAGRIKDIADKAEVAGSSLYPHANEAMRVADRYAGGDINPTQIQVIREGLADAVQGTEGRQRKIARDMLKAFDEETIPLAPELADARKTASKYLSAEQIGRAIELADPRSGQYSQSGLPNALKTEFRNLDRQEIKGAAQFHPDVVDAIRKVDRGTPYTRAAEWVGKLAPTTPFSLSAGTLAPAGLATAIGGPAAGGIVAATTPVLGMFGRGLAGKAVKRNADLAELLARNGGALPRPTVLTPEMRRLVSLGLLGQQSQHVRGD